MRAMALGKPAPVETAPLEKCEVPAPKPGPGEILVRIEACGLCRTQAQEPLRGVASPFDIERVSHRHVAPTGLAVSMVTVAGQWQLG